MLNHFRQRWLTMGRGLWGLGRPSYEPSTLQRAVEEVPRAEALAALPRLHLAITEQGKHVA